MKSATDNPRLFGAILAAALVLSCSGASDKWTGSVDAVFRYRPSDRSTVVHEVRPGSSSETAGLEAGDRILAVDGIDVTEFAYEEVRAAMRGPVGTVALVSIQRDDALLDLDVERRPTKSAEPTD